MAKQVDNLTLVTGPAGCSKSTLVNLAQMVASDHQIIGIDSSKCLANSRKFKTEAGLALIKLNDDQDKGIILPGNPVVESIMENIGWIRKERKPLHILIAGCPRSPEEVDMWLSLKRMGTVSVRTLLVECTYTEVVKGVQTRIDKGEIRPDNGPSEIVRRWDEYQKKTLPGIDKVPAHLVARTSRSKPLHERLVDLISVMDIPDQVRKKWLRRLDEKSHPVRQEIRLIERGVQKLEAASKTVPVTFSEAPPQPLPHIASA